MRRLGGYISMCHSSQFTKKIGKYQKLNRSRLITIQQILIDNFSSNDSFYINKIDAILDKICDFSSNNDFYLEAIQFAKLVTGVVKTVYGSFFNT
jgi:CMP-N-acetylneuraminic acid synthetase